MKRTFNYWDRRPDPRAVNFPYRTFQVGKVLAGGLLIFVTVASGVRAADTIQVSAPLVKATVFPRGAQVFRAGKFSVPTGVSRLVVADLAGQLDVASLQAGTGENVQVLDVQHVVAYVEPPVVSPGISPERLQTRIDSLQDTLTWQTFTLEGINARRQALENEKRLVAENPLMHGGGRSDSLPILQETADFYRQRTTEIEQVLQQLKWREYQLNHRRGKTQKALHELQAFLSRTGQPKGNRVAVQQAVVTVLAAAPARATLRLQYLVQDAGWRPAYDIRAGKRHDAVDLTYKAYVQQNTGELWEQIPLTLSTYHQQCLTSKPHLDPWFIDYYIEGHRPLPVRAANFISPVEARSNLNTGYEALPAAHQSQGTFPQTSALDQVQVEYTTDYQNSVPGDNQEVLLAVQERSAEATFTYYALPKANPAAFLLARLGNWERLDLLHAPANVYLDGTLVGKTNINPRSTSDTLELAVGIDQAVFCTRKKVRDENRQNGLGKNQVRTLQFEITVRNNKAVPITLTLEDQVPVSRKEDISVKLGDTEGADFQKQTGFLTWQLNLAPGQSRTVRFAYEVTYAKGKRLS